MSKLKSTMVMCVMICLGLSGCTIKGKESHTEIENTYRKLNTWQPTPLSIRIYPTTRFAYKDKQQILEARVELFDEMGDSVKGSGMYAFELLEAVGPSGGGAGTQLYTWNIDLADIEAQKQHYDPIARGYYFQLKMHEQQVARQGGVLRVVFTPEIGPRLSAQQQIYP